MNIFKTNYRRVREGIMQSVGAHEATTDHEFDARVHAFQLLVRDMERVLEAMLLWADCMDAMSVAGAGLGDAMSKFFCANSPPGAGAGAGGQSRRSGLDASSRAYLSVQADVNESLRGSVRRTLLERCLKPTTEVLAVAPLINEKVALRKQLMLDSNFYNAKYKHEINAGKDESDPKVAKIAAKMRDARKTLLDLSNELLETFAEIEDARSTLLIPEVSALVGSQFFYMQNSAQMLSDVMSFFPQSASTLCALHTEKAAAPYLSKKVVDNLKSTATCSASTTISPVAASGSDPSSPGRGLAAYSMGLRPAARPPPVPAGRPFSEQVRGTASPPPPGQPRSVPLGSSEGPFPFPAAAPPPLPAGLPVPGKANVVKPVKPVKKPVTSAAAAVAGIGIVIYIWHAMSMSFMCMCMCIYM
jgi:hypothetical protein